MLRSATEVRAPIMARRQRRGARTDTVVSWPRNPVTAAVAGPARAGASGQPAPTAAGAASASTTQLTAPPAAGQAAAYPGQRFGLPERGSGSVASMPRRVLALLIDWLLSMLIAYWLTHSQFWTIAVFAVEVYVLTATTGFTVGKRLVGIRVIRTDGGLVGFRLGPGPDGHPAHRDPAAADRPRPARPARPRLGHHRRPALAAGQTPPAQAIREQSFQPGPLARLRLSGSSAWASWAA